MLGHPWPTNIWRSFLGNDLHKIEEPITWLLVSYCSFICCIYDCLQSQPNGATLIITLSDFWQDNWIPFTNFEASHYILTSDSLYVIFSSPVLQSRIHQKNIIWKEAISDLDGHSDLLSA
jgi:hypothetical protein